MIVVRLSSFIVTISMNDLRAMVNVLKKMENTEKKYEDDREQMRNSEKPCQCSYIDW